jgi:GH35 family endo-1,4-beta-xylanase
MMADVTKKGENLTIEKGCVIVKIKKKDGINLKKRNFILSAIITVFVLILNGNIIMASETQNAVPSSHSVFVDGVATPFRAFNISGSNFFMLRDIAYVLNGSESQFQVAWDSERNAINILAGVAYTPLGGEMAVGGGGATQIATPSTASVYINGTISTLRAYNIGGNNFFMLRDLGDALGFLVDWDEGQNAVLISTSAPTETRTIVYSLRNDVDLQGLVIGENITNTIADFTYLLPSGRPILTMAENNGIRVSGRTNNWDGLGVRISPLNFVQGAVYTMQVMGRVESPIPVNTRLELIPTGHADGFRWVGGAYMIVTEANPNFTLTIPMFATNSVITIDPLKRYPLSSFNQFTIQTNPDASAVTFIIENITITPIVPSVPLSADRFPSLAEEFANYFLIGNVWGGGGMNHYMLYSGAMEHFLHHFNAMTAQNHHKPHSIAPRTRNTNISTWDWDDADFIVNWANENNIYLTGHALVWHHQSQPWFTNIHGTTQPLTRADAIANMELHINAVAQRYNGRMFAWDVVNEAIVTHGNSFRASPDWRNHLRQCSDTGLNINNGDVQWYNAFANGAVGNECGSDYIFYAFRFARLADPHAILIYNDYSTEWHVKYEAISQMVEQINERWQSDPLYDNRLLVEVIGKQMHTFQGTNLNDIRSSIRRFSQTGARIHITELSVNPVPWDFAGFGWQNRNTILTSEQVQIQSDMFRDLFEIFVYFANYIDRVSMWGTNMNYSMFERDFEPRPAFGAVMDLIN